MDLPIRSLTEPERLNRRIEEFIEKSKNKRSVTLTPPPRTIITLKVFAEKLPNIHVPKPN